MDLKSWLDYLYYKIGNQRYDFELCRLWKDGENTKSSKWVKYSTAIFPLDFDESYKIRFNQRQILPFEIVFDLEEKDQLAPLLDKLDPLGIKYYVFATGSRGFHVHCFFNRQLNEKEKTAILSYYGADIQKGSNRTMIALEYAPHWKSNQVKTEVLYERD